MDFGGRDFFPGLKFLIQNISGIHFQPAVTVSQIRRRADDLLPAFSDIFLPMLFHEFMYGANDKNSGKSPEDIGFRGDEVDCLRFCIANIRRS